MAIVKPVFIIGSYRGGTSLLFRLLSESNDLWSMYRESNHIWQKYHRHPLEKSDTTIFKKQDDGSFKNLITNRVISDISDVREAMEFEYDFSTFNSYSLGYLGRIKFLREKLPFLLNIVNFFSLLYKKLFVQVYRFIDKTPPNIYRVELLERLYPDAKFVYLVRDKDENVQSLVNAWTHKKKFKYPYRSYLTKGKKVDIKGYEDDKWKFYIPLDWYDYLETDIETVCAHQYDDAHLYAQNAFSKIDSSKWMQVQFEDLLANPDQEIEKICDFVEIDYSDKMKKIVDEMPAVNTDLKKDKNPA